MPNIPVELAGQEKIRARGERLQDQWEFFVQNTHPGTIQLDGDTVTGRAYMQELARTRDGCQGQHGQMGREHRYRATITWTGNLGEGTVGYRSYSRDHEVSGEGKPALPGSSDPAFRGDPKRWNPEELLVAALAQCHMLWFLHLCAVNGIVVTSYIDDAQGTMAEGEDGGGEFTTVTLRPRAAIADSGQANRALDLHQEAHRLCFIARSVNFPVSCEPVIT